MSFDGKKDPFKFSEIIQNNKFDDIVDKFRTFRLNAEATEIKLKEANTVIDQLKTDISISRDVETNLRSQITSAQNRLIHSQKIITKVLTVTERIRETEKASLEIERKVNQIEEVIQKVKGESQHFLKSTSNELNLMKKYEELKSKMKNKESEINLLKIENQALSKDKQEIEIQTEHKYKILENNLEELKREKTEMQIQYDQTLRVYKKQIEDHEVTISEYERERKSLLEEFAIPKISEGNSDIAWADSTVLLIPEDRSPKNSKPVKSSMDLECDGKNQVFSNCANSQGSLTSATKKYVSFKQKKGGCKQKPQLEFLIQTPSPKTSSDALPPKRRLFSTNCNHYAS